MSLTDVFKVEPKSIYDFLSEDGLGIYIPYYQRPYDWNLSNVKSILENAYEGMAQLTGTGNGPPENLRRINLIGTIISLHDKKQDMIHPIIRHKTPSKVVSIIDGQQRITSLVLTTTVLHKLIQKTLTKKSLHQKNNSALEIHLRELCEGHMKQLKKCFQITRDIGNKNFYPKIIRAYEDLWSDETSELSYKSNIAEYLFKYINMKEPNSPSKQTPGSQHIHSIIKGVETYITQDIMSDSQKNILIYQKIISSPDLQALLLDNPFDAKIATQLEESRCIQKYMPLINLLFYTSFIKNRIAITLATVRDEDYAFEMFENLNTTGEPLTAFATFVPKVIKNGGEKEYHNSPSFQSMDYITKTLERFTESNSRNAAVSEFIIPFALAFSNYKLTKKPNEQRRYLAESYQKLSRLEDKRKFVFLLETNCFMSHEIWKNPDIKEITLSEQTKFFLDFLKKIKHKILIAPLSLYLYHARYPKDDDSKKHAIQNFEDAVRSFTSYAVLWRGTRSTTEGIDSEIRKIVCDHFKVTPSIQTLNSALHASLSKKGVGKLEDWVFQCIHTPIYKNLSVAKFILLAAIEQQEKPQNGISELQPEQNSNSIFSLSGWLDDNLDVVTQIAPTDKNPKWDSSIYTDTFSVHKLGNLVLLPKPFSKSLENKNWAEKKSLLKKFTQIEQIPSKDGYKKQNPYMIDSNLQNLKRITTSESYWNLSCIDKRSKQLANAAWHKISKWLEPTYIHEHDSESRQFLIVDNKAERGIVENTLKKEFECGTQTSIPMSLDMAKREKMTLGKLDLILINLNQEGTMSFISKLDELSDFNDCKKLGYSVSKRIDKSSYEKFSDSGIDSFIYMEHASDTKNLIHAVNNLIS